MTYNIINQLKERLDSSYREALDSVDLSRYDMPSGPLPLYDIVDVAWNVIACCQPKNIDTQQEINALLESKALSPEKKVQDAIVVSLMNIMDRDALIENASPFAEAAVALGISQDVLQQKVDDQELVVIERNGKRYFPNWELQKETQAVTSSVIQALKQGIAADINVATWMTSPNVQLDNKVPTDMLNEYNVEAAAVVLAQAQYAAGRADW